MQKHRSFQRKRYNDRDEQQLKKGILLRCFGSHSQLFLLSCSEQNYLVPWADNSIIIMQSLLIVSCTQVSKRLSYKIRNLV